MSSTVSQSALTGYGRADQTENYEKSRTDYTLHSIQLIVDKTLVQYVQQLEDHKSFPLTVIDLGSGTGKFTRAFAKSIQQLTHDTKSPLHQLQLDIVGVEPVEAMRQKLIEQIGNLPIRCVEGSGDNLPFADGSVALAVASQSFHWFATASAMKEIHRVLQPNAYLCMVWNTRNTHVKWVRALDDIIDSYYLPNTPRQQDNSWKACVEHEVEQHQFGKLEHIHLENHIVMDWSVEEVIGTVLSISDIAHRSDDEKEVVMQKVRDLLSTHEETKGKQRYQLPYNTDIFYCRKL